MHNRVTFTLGDAGMISRHAAIDILAFRVLSKLAIIYQELNPFAPGSAVVLVIAPQIEQEALRQAPVVHVQVVNDLPVDGYGVRAPATGCLAKGYRVPLEAKSHASSPAGCGWGLPICEGNA